jgi:hypothetical protein
MAKILTNQNLEVDNMCERKPTTTHIYAEKSAHRKVANREFN